MNEFYIVIILCISITVALANVIFAFFAIKTLITFYKGNEIEKKEIKRKHPNNSKVDFASQLVGRKNPYSKYQNTDGLYEPQMGKNGIEIKVKKEEE